MKNKRTAISRATKIFLATSAIALSATVMAQFSGDMPQGALNLAAQAYLNANDDRSPQAIQAVVSTAMSAGVSAQAITEALIASRMVPWSDAISAAIKQGGNPALIGSTAVNAIMAASSPDGNSANTVNLRSDVLAQVKAAGGDVSAIPVTPGGREVEVVMQQMKNSPNLQLTASSIVSGNQMAQQEIRELIRQNGAEAVATALSLQGVSTDMLVKLVMTAPQNGNESLTPTPEATKSLMDGIIKGVMRSDPSYNTAALVQAQAADALIEVVAEKSKGIPGSESQSNLLKELSKTVDPSKLAAIASQLSTSTAIVGSINMAMNVSGPLTVAFQLGVPLETLTKAVLASGFTTPTGFEVSIDDGNGGKNKTVVVTPSPGTEGKAIGDTAAETLIRLAGNSDTDLKAVMAAVKASGGSTDAYVAAAISQGVDPAKVTAATASGTPSPAPVSASVAVTPSTPPSPAAATFSGSPPSSISGGGAVAVSKS